MAARLSDRMRAARFKLLDVACDLERRMDELDPTGKERYESDGDSELALLFDSASTLRMANRMLYDAEMDVMRGGVKYD